MMHMSNRSWKLRGHFVKDRRIGAMGVLRIHQESQTTAANFESLRAVRAANEGLQSIADHIASLQLRLTASGSDDRAIYYLPLTIYNFPGKTRRDDRGCFSWARLSEAGHGQGVFRSEGSDEGHLRNGHLRDE